MHGHKEIRQDETAGDEQDHGLDVCSTDEISSMELEPETRPKGQSILPDGMD
jgi:hypothetical protein